MCAIEELIIIIIIITNIIISRTGILLNLKFWQWPFSKMAPYFSCEHTLASTTEPICELFEANESPYHGRDMSRFCTTSIDQKVPNMVEVKIWGGGLIAVQIKVERCRLYLHFS